MRDSQTQVSMIVPRIINIHCFSRILMYITSMILGVIMVVPMLVNEHILMSGVGHLDFVQNRKSRILRNLPALRIMRHLLLLRLYKGPFLVTHDVIMEL